MTDHTKEDLESSLAAITSMISKIEKVRAKETLRASQRTLIERRLKALAIASELLNAKLREFETA